MKNNKATLKKTVSRAFTLIELLVVMSVFSLLMAVLVPALGAARDCARQVVCKSNVRQLVLANIGYAGENNGSYVPAASDICSSNLHRWHGVRDSINEPFDPLRGPLAGYLADGRVNKCPGKVDFRHGDPWDWDFEDGCGGYGYNMIYIGSRVWCSYSDENCRVTARASDISRPGETLMFADTAMTKLDNGVAYYLEYSFAEPCFFVVNGRVAADWAYASPSIHFRHSGEANVGWADGHVGSRQMAEFDGINVYGVRSADMNLGWFEPLDNSMFDLQ